MKLIIKGRQTGKTTGLIHTSEATGYNIITPNKVSARNIEKMASDLGCTIPRVLTVEEIKNPIDIDVSIERKFLLDDAELILEDALKNYLGVNIAVAAINNEQIELNKLRGNN